MRIRVPIFHYTSHQWFYNLALLICYRYIMYQLLPPEKSDYNYMTCTFTFGNLVPDTWKLIACVFTFGNLVPDTWKLIAANSWLNNKVSK